MADSNHAYEGFRKTLAKALVKGHSTVTVRTETLRLLLAERDSLAGTTHELGPTVRWFPEANVSPTSSTHSPSDSEV